MKAFPFFIPEKKLQIGFLTKISVTHRFHCFTSCQLSASLAGVPQRFQLLPQGLAIGLSRLYGKLPWWCSPYRFKRSSNFMPRASTLLAWVDVRVGFPSALMRVVALMAFFCSIHSFLCNCGDRMERLDRHLTSEGCNTFSMAKTSGKAQCAPYYKNTITYS